MNNTALYEFYHEKSGLQYNDINTLVASALYYVIEQYFLEMVPAFVLTLCCSNPHTCNFFNAMLEQMFQLWGIAPVQIVNIQYGFSKRVGGRRYYNLLLIDSYQALNEIDIVSYTANYNRNEFYYIFLQARDEQIDQEIQLILEYCWRHYLINCNVQIQNAKGEVLIYTFYPFTPEHCDKVVPVLINEFNGTHLVNPILFPNKLKNFYGCRLRAAVWNVPPFLSLHTDDFGVQSIAGGFEGYLLLTLANHLNFTIDINVPPNKEQRGVISRGVANGALSMLQSREADLSLGAFRQSEERDHIVSSAQNHYQTYQAYVVLDSDFKPTSLETFLYPFNNYIWLLLFLVFLSVIAAFQVQAHLNRHSQMLQSFFSVFAMLVGIPTAVGRLNLRKRCLIVIFLLFTLVMRSIYSGLLYHLIRSKLRLRVPSSFNDLVDSNFTVVLIQAANASLSNISGFHKLRTIVLNTTLDIAGFQYIELNQRQNLVAVGPVDFLLHYGRTNSKAGVFRVLPEHVINFQVTMYLTKHSFLIDQFTDVILWIRATGLLAAWARWELDLNYFAKQHDSSDDVFGFEHLYVGFVVLLIGLLLSLFVFVLELLARYNKRLQEVLEKL